MGGLDAIAARIGPSPRWWRDELARDVLGEWRCTVDGTIVTDGAMPATKEAMGAMLRALQNDMPGSVTGLDLDYVLGSGSRVTLAGVTIDRGPP